MTCDLGRDGAAGADRDAQDYEIGAAGCFRIGFDDAIDDAEFHDAGAGLCRARGGDDLLRQSLFASCARDRAADQPEANERDPIKMRLSAHFALMKSRKPSTTSRLASSVPIVNRRACGSL